jgi:uncharacterized protein (DUF1697 family)
VTRFIALLRGINVGGNNPVPMAGLREVCQAHGWGGVRTYIQSGNVLFEAGGPPDILEAELELGIRRRFGLAIPVLVRSAADWEGYVRGNPFPVQARAEPNRVMLGISKHPPDAGAVDALRERATAGEGVERAGDVLWFHFPAGPARSRLTPAVLDRLAGSPVTLRNWRTVLKLAELAGGR